MADERLRIVIEALNNSRRELEQLQKDLGGIEAKSTKAAPAIGSVGKALAGMVTVAAVTRIAKVGYELAVLGAESERAENAFVRMAGSTAQADAMLAQLKATTLGTKSEIELMQNATTLMALGFGDSAEQLAQISRNVEALGSRFGGTMQTFQLMMSNDSLMRIDSFGIGVEEATERIEEFKAAGMEAGEAFDAAILELMNEKFEQLGGVLDDDITNIERTQAAWQDLKAEFGKTIEIGAAAESTANLTRYLADLLGKVNDLRNAYGDQAVTQAYRNTVYGYGQGTTLGDLEQQLRAQNAAAQRGAALAEYYADKQAEAAAATEAGADANKRWTRSADGAMAASMKLADSQESLAAAHRADRAALEELAAQQQAYARREERATLLVDAVNSNLTDTLDDQYLSLRDIGRQRADMLVQLRDLQREHGTYVTTQKEAVLTGHDLAIAQFELAKAQERMAEAEPDSEAWHRAAKRAEDLQAKINDTGSAITSMVDKSGEIDELTGKIGDATAQMAALRDRTRETIASFLFQQLVGKLDLSALTGGQEEMLRGFAESAGIDTAFIDYNEDLNQAIEMTDELGESQDEAAEKGRRWGEASKIAADKVNVSLSDAYASISWAHDEIAFSAGIANEQLDGVARSTYNLRDEAEKSYTPLQNFGLAGQTAAENIYNGVIPARDALADIPETSGIAKDALLDLAASAEEYTPPIKDFGDAGKGAGDDIAEAMKNARAQMLGIPEDVAAAQAAIDSMHGKDIDINLNINTHRNVGNVGQSQRDLLPDLEGYATGGLLPMGAYGIAGEGGMPELLHATPQGVDITPLGGGGSGGGALGNTINISINGAMDPVAVAAEVKRQLKPYMGAVNLR